MSTIVFSNRKEKIGGAVDLLTQKNILIIGLGLIGGSVARGLRNYLCQDPQRNDAAREGREGKEAGEARERREPAGLILAHGRDPAPLAQAKADGVIDEYSTDLAAVVPRADIIIIAVPTLTVRPVLEQLHGLVKADAIISDAASVKGQVVADFEAIFGASFTRFVPAHPIAGSEKSGYAASREDLFRQRRVILTPSRNCESLAVRTIARLWRVLGAQVLGMSVDRHDAVLAATSHLPHLLAYTLVNTLSRQEQSADILYYAAGGFADFTRIASSDPLMWRDIFLANTEATVNILDQYSQDLARMRAALVSGDGELMINSFAQAKLARDKFAHKYPVSSSARPGSTLGGAIDSNLRQTVMKDNKQSEAHSSSRELDYLAEPAPGSVCGDIRVPGDKSISHRAIIFGSIADGVTHVKGFLEGEDALHTLQAFRSMGVVIVGPEDGEVTIYGAGKSGLQQPESPLYLGNSGTAMRLMCGLLAAQPFASELHGDASLTRRPMDRVADPLRRMGAQIDTASGGTPPLRINGARLQGISYEMPIASAQVKSCIMLAALYATGETRIGEPAPCRDHTERMLQGFSYPVKKAGDSRETVLNGGFSLTATEIDVPADISSAAFFLVAAAITPGSNLKLRHVGVNPTRTGIINLLRAMGADIKLSNESTAGGEPVADIEIVYAELSGIDIPEEQIPLAIDEFPALFIAAACARGRTVLRGAEELRVKESDRIQAMADGLTTLGIATETYPDGIAIEGGQIQGGDIDSQGDHRIAMAFTVASLRASESIRIRNCANVTTSFPGFLELAQQAGIRVTQGTADR